MENYNDDNIKECIICGQLFELEDWTDEDDFDEEVCPECEDGHLFLIEDF